MDTSDEIDLKLYSLDWMIIKKKLDADKEKNFRIFKILLDVLEDILVVVF